MQHITAARAGRAARAVALAALAGPLALPAARAQFTMNLYGILDASVGRFQASGGLVEHAVRSGQMATSRFGLAGRELLDDGWSVGFTLESFFRLNTGEQGRNDRDPFWSREASLSVGQAGLGTLKVGRFGTPLFEATGRFNAFGPSPGFSPALRHTFLSGPLGGAQGDLYWDRAIGWTSPNWDGLTVRAMRASSGALGREPNTGLSLVYARGLVTVGLNLQRTRHDERQPQGTDERVWQLAGTYNAGFGKAFAQYTRTRDPGFDVRSRIWSVGAAVPLGPGQVLVQFAQTDAEGLAVDRRHQTVSLGYDMELSRQTDLYVVAMRDQVRRQATGMTLAAGLRVRY
ncbi:MAG: hypothetical protein RL456_2367 [Pseudomonadota bacterium]